LKEESIKFCGNSELKFELSKSPCFYRVEYSV
jgi:hypothetical protein